MLDLTRADWDPGLRLLVLAPHPDDFDEVGVTLRWFHERGHELHLAVVSGSASGVLDSFCPPAEQAARREAEQLSATRFFGLSDDRVRFLRLPEDDSGAPVEDAAASRAIAALLAELRPNLVFLPHGADTNLGHQRVYRLFTALAEEFGCTGMLQRDPKTTDFRTDWYTPFDETDAAWKRRLLLHHESQEHRNRLQRQAGFDDRILATNAAIARELALEEPYAEAFMVETGDEL